MAWKLTDPDNSNSIYIKSGDVIGRKDVKLVFPECEKMSRSHAQFMVEEDKLYITDLSSRNGTLINLVRIIPDARVKLKKGDRLCIGGKNFIIENDDEKTVSHLTKTITKKSGDEHLIERHPMANLDNRTISNTIQAQPHIMSEKSDKTHEFRFSGQRAELLKIMVINLLSSLATLGIYSAWGMTQLRNYIWQSTSVNGYQFKYHGKPKDLLLGIVAGLISTALYTVFAKSVLFSDIPNMTMMKFIVNWISLAVIHILYFANFVYLIKQTSYKEVFFNYASKDFSEYVLEIFKHSAITLITLGIYYPIMSIKLFERRWNHTYLGKDRFKCKVNTMEYFLLWWSGMCLVLLTLGLYFPWFATNNHKYKVSTLNFKGTRFESSLEGMEYFSFYIWNLFLNAITLGVSAIYYFPVEGVLFIEHLSTRGKYEVDSNKEEPH